MDEGEEGFMDSRLLSHVTGGVECHSLRWETLEEGQIWDENS